MKTFEVISKKNAEHYNWGNGCDAWHFLKRDDLSIIIEEVPAGETEKRHFHNRSRQFFYVLSGTASIEIGNQVLKVRANEGLEIEPSIAHRLYNSTNEYLKFIVISRPKSHGDRFEVP